MTASKIIWHGTPADLRPEDIAPRVSFLDAIWLTGTPEIAALYAGPHGTVHGFVLAPGARLLSAFGHDPALPWSYPAEGEWQRIRLWLSDHVEIDELDCLDAFKIDNGFQPPLGPAGQPSWEGLYGDLCELMSVGEDLLREMGYDGIMQTERCELALGDRSATISRCSDPAYNALAARIAEEPKRPSASIGLLHGSSLVHACSVPAEQVIRMQVPRKLLPVTEAGDLARWAGAPAPSWTSMTMHQGTAGEGHSFSLPTIR